MWGQDKFKPGPFYTGRFSTLIAVVASCYLALAIILSMFPTSGPKPTSKQHPPYILLLARQLNVSANSERHERRPSHHRCAVGKLIALLLLFAKKNGSTDQR
jgi:hypothetical protein